MHLLKWSAIVQHMGWNMKIYTWKLFAIDFKTLLYKLYNLYELLHNVNSKSPAYKKKQTFGLSLSLSFFIYMSLSFSLFIPFTLYFTLSLSISLSICIPYPCFAFSLSLYSLYLSISPSICLSYLSFAFSLYSSHLTPQNMVHAATLFTDIGILIAILVLVLTDIYACHSNVPCSERSWWDYAAWVYGEYNELYWGHRP